MMAWFNENQGFLMVLLTFIYVITTIVIVAYNHKSIKEMQKTREADIRTYIFVDLYKEPRDHWFFLRIKNYGRSSAKINNLIISPKLKLINNINETDIMKNTVLAPNQMVQFAESSPN